MHKITNVTKCIANRNQKMQKIITANILLWLLQCVYDLHNGIRCWFIALSMFDLFLLLLYEMQQSGRRCFMIAEWL